MRTRYARNGKWRIACELRGKLGVIMTAKFQLVIDCADPEPLARFWVAVLGY
jgi:hypothetical protein